MKGPLGLAAAGVAGVGALLFNKLKEDWQTTADALKNTAQGLVDMQIEVGRQLLFNTERQKVMQDLVKQDPEFWSKTREVAESLGLTLEDVGDAILGGQDAMDALKQKLKDTVGESDVLNESAVQYGPKLTPGAAKAAELLGYLDQAGDKAEESADQFWTMESVLGRSSANAKALQENLRLARDYAAGIGGRQPLVGAGQAKAF
jgi:chromosome segregation ATPase